MRSVLAIVHYASKVQFGRLNQPLRMEIINMLSMLQITISSVFYTKGTTSCPATAARLWGRRGGRGREYSQHRSGESTRPIHLPHSMNAVAPRNPPAAPACPRYQGLHYIFAPRRLNQMI
ncbi:jg8848 [Pararge aegeria aegeria]|uniref:Jg8848 protein n=1 Tax=Pararge aegeria aegeria TaxID=348720 RepID=A0A8S4SJT8_9NEOP|nr:jg8848 [Pararge aegeria aegeria]